MPVRIQRERTKGWKMPPNTIYVGRTSGELGSMRPFANPFRVGGYFKIGDGRNGYIWLEAHPDYADPSFTKIETAEQAVQMFREYRRRYPIKDDELAKIKGVNLACWCKIGDPCHADVLLELANTPSCWPDQHRPDGPDGRSASAARPRIERQQVRLGGLPDVDERRAESGPSRRDALRSHQRSSPRRSQLKS